MTRKPIELVAYDHGARIVVAALSVRLARARTAGRALAAHYPGVDLFLEREGERWQLVGSPAVPSFRIVPGPRGAALVGFYA